MGSFEWFSRMRRPIARNDRDGPELSDSNVATVSGAAPTTSETHHFPGSARMVRQRPYVARSPAPASKLLWDAHRKALSVVINPISMGPPHEGGPGMNLNALIVM